MKSSSDNLLRFALANEPIAGVVLDGLSRCMRWGRNGKIVCAIPEEYRSQKSEVRSQKSEVRSRFCPSSSVLCLPYAKNVPIWPELLRKAKRDEWFVISNGRFATQIDSQLLNKVLTKIRADVVAVNVEPELLGKREIVIAREIFSKSTCVSKW